MKLLADACNLPSREVWLVGQLSRDHCRFCHSPFHTPRGTFPAKEHSLQTFYVEIIPGGSVSRSLSVLYAEVPPQPANIGQGAAEVLVPMHAVCEEGAE